ARLWRLRAGGLPGPDGGRRQPPPPPSLHLAARPGEDRLPSQPAALSARASGAASPGRGARSVDRWRASAGRRLCARPSGARLGGSRGALRRGGPRGDRQSPAGPPGRSAVSAVIPSGPSGDLLVPRDLDAVVGGDVGADLHGEPPLDGLAIPEEGPELLLVRRRALAAHAERLHPAEAV